MGKVKLQITMSLDGFVAGPNQSLEDPLGRDGMRLHEWVFDLASFREQHGQSGGERSPDDELFEATFASTGAFVMGRNMFSGGFGPGPWEDDPNARGWWGDDPPFKGPVFVLSHYPREPLEMEGGTTFFFVDGARPAVERAQAAAGDKDVQICGGASAVQVCLRAGLIDELQIHVAPLLLGDGIPLFDGSARPDLEITRVERSPKVTHLWYRVVK
ncbi:MAG: dihydrofolate reductase family protein [Gaiellaceae bacterium]